MPNSVKSLYTDQEINTREKRESNDSHSRHRKTRYNNVYEEDEDQDEDWGYDDID